MICFREYRGGPFVLKVGTNKEVETIYDLSEEQATLVKSIMKTVALVERIDYTVSNRKLMYVGEEYATQTQQLAWWALDELGISYDEGHKLIRNLRFMRQFRRWLLGRHSLGYPFSEMG